MTDPRQAPGLSDLVRSRLAPLFFAGLLLRLLGLLFYGMGDLHQILLDWGLSVWHRGLVDAFSINYGVFSYAVFGLAAGAAEHLQRFWWAPYKLWILGFDLALLLVLFRLAPPDRAPLTLALYWLNPWFIVHEAYYGFWESPHILFGLLAVLAVSRSGKTSHWGLAGALLMCSAMFKPQGLLYFVVPTGIYLTVQWLRGSRAPLHRWMAGGAAVVATLSLLFWAGGGSPLALVDNYRSAFVTQSGPSNGGPGVWRFFSFAYGAVTGQHEHVAFVHMPRLLTATVSAVAGLACMTIFVLFSLRLTLTPDRVDHGQRIDSTRDRKLYPFRTVSRQPAEILLLVLALGSITMSQFGVRAHINHSYTAAVMIIPLAVTRPGLLRQWAALIGLLGISHLLIFALGAPVLLPPPEVFGLYPSATLLLSRVQALPAYANPDALLRFQKWVATVVYSLPGELLVSLLSPLVFVIAVQIVRSLFAEVREGSNRVPARSAGA